MPPADVPETPGAQRGNLVAWSHFTPAPARMTVDEFLVWAPPDRSGRLWQLVDGEPVAMAPDSENHGALQGEIGRLIANHLRASRPDCRLIVTPGIVPHLNASRNFRIPDLGVTCAPPSTEIMVPDPVLLIEILSPSNQTETWRKFWRYAARELKRSCGGDCRTATGPKLPRLFGQVAS